MPSWTELALECARVARKGLRLPEGESAIAVILGSGLGAFADSLDDPRGLAFSELPGFPPATVPGHRGRLVYGKVLRRHDGRRWTYKKFVEPTNDQAD